MTFTEGWGIFKKMGSIAFSEISKIELNICLKKIRFFIFQGNDKEVMVKTEYCLSNGKETYYK